MLSLLKNYVQGRPVTKANNDWLAALAQSWGGWNSGRFNRTGLTLNMNTPLTFEQAVRLGYKQIPWVRACIAYTGQTMGSIEWKVYKKNSNRPIKDHELELLLRRPNKFKTRTDFFNDAIGSLLLSGAVFTQKVITNDWAAKLKGKAGGKKPTELWIMRPDWIAPIPDKKDFISGYQLTGGAIAQNGNLVFPADEVIYQYYADPLIPYLAISPISSATRSIAAEEGAHTWNSALLNNYAQPSGVLQTENTLMPQDREQLREEITEAYSGANMYTPLVLWGGLKWQQISMSHADIQFTEQREITKHEICAVLQVPGILVNAVPDPNYSSAAVARLEFMENRIIPLCAWFAETFNRDLAPYWGDDIEVRYDVSKVPAMRKALMDKVTAFVQLTKNGYSINDVNDKLDMGFDKKPWGDVWWAPTGVMPVESAELDDLMPGADPNGGDGRDEDNEDETDPNKPDDPNAVNPESADNIGEDDDETEE